MLTATSDRLLAQIDFLKGKIFEIDGEFYVRFNDVKSLLPSKNDLEAVEEEAVIHWIAVTEGGVKDVR